MCGIAAFSKPEGSSANARLLAHHLLTQIENRGSHASGFAYINADGGVGIYKNPTPGSQLSLHELPRDARTVVIHTRYATQGPQSDNRNNHPVISTDRRIALVHNGVISNDHRLRPLLGIEARHGLVDSLVIPSMIAQQGTDGLSQMSGYAAIAWLDVQSSTKLFIARLKNSPVAYTHLFDGTFVMASTPNLLEGALKAASFEYGGVFEMSDSKMMTVEGGFILEHTGAPRMSFDSGSWNRHSAATAGGHTVTRTTPAGTTVYPPRNAGSEDKAVVMSGMEDAESVDVDQYFADLEEWRSSKARQDMSDAAIGGKAMAMLTGPSDSWTDEEWDSYTSQLEERDERERAERENMSCSLEQGTGVAEYGEGFYILDGEGDVSHYTDLDLMERQLEWLSKMSRQEFDLFQVEDNLNWINHIMDLGHIESDGELVSWVDDSSNVDEFENRAVPNLQYIREGAQRLSMLKGA